MKKLINLRTSPALCIAFEFILPAIITVLIWIVVYAFLKEAVRENEGMVKDLGPAGIMVAWNRRRLGRWVKKGRDAISKR